MPEKFEKLLKLVYKKWRLDAPSAPNGHPDEETLASFAEARLSEEENERLRAHLSNCDNCMEAFILNFKAQAAEMIDLPAGLITQAKNLINREADIPALEIALRIKEKLLEIINTTGDVLMGQELLPAPILRSRRIKDFKDELSILKDFQDIRAELKIENKGKAQFNLFITVKQKQTQEIIKDLRVTLIRDGLELESCLTESGGVCFEHVLVGKYTIEISSIENKLARILLDMQNVT